MTYRDDTSIVLRQSSRPRAEANQQPDAIEPAEPAEPIGRAERRGFRRLWGLLYRSVRRQSTLLDELTALLTTQDRQIRALTTRVDLLKTKIEMLERR